MKLLILMIILSFSFPAISQAQSNPLISAACSSWEITYEERVKLSQERSKVLNNYKDEHRGMLKTILNDYKEMGIDAFSSKPNSDFEKKQYTKAIYTIAQSFKKSHENEFTPGLKLGWNYSENLFPNDEGIVEYDSVVFPATMKQITIFSKKPRLSTSLEVRSKAGGNRISVCTAYHEDSIYKWTYGKERFNTPVFDDKGRYYDHDMPRAMCTSISLKDGKIEESENDNRYNLSYTAFLKKFKGPQECLGHGKYASTDKPETAIKDKNVVDSRRELVPSSGKDNTTKQLPVKTRQTTTIE